ncbi:MAG: YraN family protein [Candidatus Daviesbacteria bacterium]|nr:YraN family protein [Candidatus Daviesbacteria bacterium]
MSNTDIGNKGEELACKYLKKLGYRILERNFRIRGGEIDIVVKDGNTLVFVEVKTRYSHDFGLPAESMTPWKIRSLLKTARFYIQKINWGEREYRLDFMGVDFAESGDNPKIELIKNIAL